MSLPLHPAGWFLLCPCMHAMERLLMMMAVPAPAPAPAPARAAAPASALSAAPSQFSEETGATAQMLGTEVDGTSSVGLPYSNTKGVWHFYTPPEYTHRQ